MNKETIKEIFPFSEHDADHPTNMQVVFCALLWLGCICSKTLVTGLLVFVSVSLPHWASIHMLSWSRKIGCCNDRIVLKLDRHLGSAATELPVKF